MKKIKIKIALLIFFLLILPLGVTAENIVPGPGGTITGSQTASAGCTTSSLYCYSGAGIRLSLYYYDGEKYNKVGASHDIWSTKNAYPGKDDSWTSDLYHYSSLSNDNDGISDRVSNGTTWKNNGTTWLGTCSSHTGETNINCTKITRKYKVFNLSFSEYKESGGFETTSAWGDYTASGNSEFIAWIDTYLKEKMKTQSDINNYFKTKIRGQDVKKYYITIEPIFRIWVNSGANKNNGYIGTVYEISKIYHYSNYSKALRSITGEEGSFIGEVLLATPETIPNTMSNVGWKVLNQYAYGVGVYKLSDYAEASCECEDNDYKCAMDYCDSATDEAGRKDCVTNTCGVKNPGFKDCSKSKTVGGKTTTCTSSASSNKQTCTPGDGNTYYQTICTEESKVYYNDSLPTSLSPGMGFTYSLLLSGTKTCNASFDVDKWNFDYAISTNSNRGELTKKLNNYKSLKKDDLEKFKYNSSNADVSIDIEENIEQKEKRITNKKLKLLPSPNKSDITVSNSKDEFKTMIEKKKSKNKTFTSSMSSIYTLPDVCINGATGDIYDADYNSTMICKTANDGPYNKFFTSLKAKTAVNNTTVKITKSSSGMDGLTNKCYYQVEDKPLKCVIEKKENIYSLKIYSEYDIDYTKLRYVLSSDPNNENWSEIPIGDNILGSIDAADLNEDGVVDELDAVLLQENLAELDNALSKGKGDVNNDGSVDIVDANILRDYLVENLAQSYNIQLDGSNLSQEMTIYGKIKYEGKDNISTICSINPIPKNDGGRCIDKYKPTQYDEIMKYCTSNWHTDKDNYISEKACCDTCSGLNSCKIQYSCSDTRGKEEFCKKQYNPVTEANSYRTCINDCACSDGEAVYRPISLSNPFPNNRQSGSNWQGYEANIAPLEKDYKPEYVIELTAEDIKNINEQTQSYNTSTKNAYTDYVSKKSNATGQYVSKFIHETNSSLFCIINGEGTCD